jgi:hypothetical protein
MADPFAELGDLEDRWQTLEEPQATRAINLLEAASRLIRAKVPGIDARIASGDLDALLVTDISCDRVRRVLVSPADGAESTTAQIGGTSVSSTFPPGVGGLRLTRPELEVLMPSTKRGKAGSQSSLPADYTPLSGTEHTIDYYTGLKELVNPYVGNDPYC